MERGTPEEERALREEWAAMERERRVTNRFLRGVSLAGFGVVLALLATAGTADAPCYPVRLQPTCTPVSLDPWAAALLLAAGVAAATYGTAVAWRTVARD